MKDKLHYLRALVDSDSKEIQEIYESNFPVVKTFVLQNKGSQQDAEDIFQKALLQITVRFKRDPFEIKSSFEGYLVAVCKNLWRRELNLAKKKVTYTEFVPQSNEQNEVILSLLEQKRWELFHENLASISENCRKILKLYFAEIPYSKIVTDMGYSSESVVRQRVFKCKKKLKKMIKEDHRYKSLQTL